MAISFTPLWRTMKNKGITTYDLRFKLKIGGGTYKRLKEGMSISTNTIDILCDYLDCEVEDIICRVKNDRQIIS